jgi:DNA-binding GntR family transcriptional regulator
MTTQMLSGRAVKPVAVRDQVAAILRDAIQMGELIPGTPLVERELCNALDVSRNTLREAMRTLEAECLLDIRPHRSPIVAVLTEKDARELYEVRTALEGEAVRLFSVRADETMIAQLKVVSYTLADAIERGATKELLHAKDQFFEVMLDGAQNAILRQYARTAYLRLAPFRLRSLQRLERRMSSAQEVRDMFEAVSAGDADTAVNLWRQHVRNAAAEALDTNPAC